MLMKRVLEVLFALTATIGTVFLLFYGFAWLYEGWWIVAPPTDRFATADLLIAFRTYALPVIVTTTTSIGVIMAWRPPNRSWLVLTVGLATLLPLALTLLQSQSFGQDWLWRGLPAVAVSLPWVLTVIWGRYLWNGRAPSLFVGVAVWLCCVTALRWLIPHLWLQDPVLDSVRSHRIDQGFSTRR
jgi:hypothetical protein